MPNIQLVFVGHHAHRLVESIRKLGIPFERILLVKGEDVLIEGEDKCWETTALMERELSPVWHVDVVMMNKVDVFKAIQQLVDTIKKARLQGDEVIINAAGSMRTLAIAGYIVACLTGSHFITALPKYDDTGKESGTDKVIHVPLLPIELPGKEQREILMLIKDGVESLDELVIKVKPGISKETQEFKNERSRVSHHLSKLENSGLVNQTKTGRNTQIQPSPLGMMILSVGANG